MQVSNRAAVPCLIAHGATACTDLTGFGLLGHLVEMTRPSGVDAELDLDGLPVLDGAAETAAAGILSSLQPANVRLRRALRNQEAALQHPNYPLLFDPQTAGGLLASVPAEAAEACIAELRSLGYPHGRRASAGSCRRAKRWSRYAWLGERSSAGALALTAPVATHRATVSFRRRNQRRATDGDAPPSPSPPQGRKLGGYGSSR